MVNDAMLLKGQLEANLGQLSLVGSDQTAKQVGLWIDTCTLDFRFASRFAVTHSWMFEQTVSWDEKTCLHKQWKPTPNTPYMPYIYIYYLHWGSLGWFGRVNVDIYIYIFHTLWCSYHSGIVPMKKILV